MRRSKTSGRRLVAAAIAVTVVALGLAAVATASVIAAAGQVEKLATPAASAQEGALESDLFIRTWDEHQCVALPQDVVVDITEPGFYGGGTGNPLTPDVIPAGTFVSSHFLHADPVGNDPRLSNAAEYDGSITTDAEILGIVVTPMKLNNSDFLGQPETTYENDPDRRVELGRVDFVIEVPDMRTVTVHFRVTDAVDNVRVITRCAAVLPGEGAFAIGDLNAAIGTNVTFWGAQWWKQNSLSGGPAPAAFKGFANSPATPACGVEWGSLPGNSVGPPSGPLPELMAVIVTSSVTKSGKSITGDTPHMVVVRTNPGYAPNPGHAGTGTVVGTIC